MQQHNKEFLDNNLHHFLTLERAFYLRGLNVHERDGMERVMSEEFATGYRCDKTCPSCVADMVRLLYRSYYNYLKAKHCDDTVYKDLTEGIQNLMDKEIKSVPACEVDTTQKLPEGNGILTVHASFPLNLPGIKDLQFYQLEKHGNISV